MNQSCGFSGEHDGQKEPFSHGAWVMCLVENQWTCVVVEHCQSEWREYLKTNDFTNINESHAQTIKNSKMRGRAFCNFRKGTTVISMSFDDIVDELEADRIRPLVSTAATLPPVWFGNKWEKTSNGQHDLCDETKEAVSTFLLKFKGSSAHVTVRQKCLISSYSIGTCNCFTISFNLFFNALSFCDFCKDAITGNSLELKGQQTILIQTRSKDKNGEKERKVNAREMAVQLSSCNSAINNDAKFDSKSGIWYDTGLIVVARPGSGKTWMMQQIAHFMCECYLRDKDSAYRFVPVLFSIQRVVRLYRASSMSFSSNGDSEVKEKCSKKQWKSGSNKKNNIDLNEITNQTDALQLLEVMLKWDYDEATVRSLLDCYNARTLVILLDGLDEASSLARMFETLGIFLAKSGNRVVMAGRPEGIKSENFYSKRPGWILLDLPELSVKQQKAIANHQIKNIEGPFFDRFYACQDRRNALEAAMKKCGVGIDEMHSALSKIKCTKMKVKPEMMLSCTVLEEVEAMFCDDETFRHDKKKDIVKFEHFTVLDFMKGFYERAKLAKAQFESILNNVSESVFFKVPNKVWIHSVAKILLKKPKCLLRKARRNGGFHNATDVVQGFIVCDDWTQMAIALKQIRKRFVAIHDIQNGFKDPDFIRYSCLTITMSIKVASGGFTFNHVVELQIHLKTMHSLLSSCGIPRDYFLGQGGLCGNEEQRMSDLKKCMDVVHAAGRTPVLLSVFLMYIKACTSKLSGEERDQTDNVQSYPPSCPPMPSSLHFMHQEAIWGTLEVQQNDPSTSLKVLRDIAFDNMKDGVLHACMC
jgi:hypothetical protein